MASFDELLSSLHENGQLQDNTNEENFIVINQKRQFIPGSEFDAVIAYEGDINSQVITFKCELIQDGHRLDNCNRKELRWKNTSSGMEGVSPLIVTNTKEEEGVFYLKWEVPSEACTQAGQLEISISIYDVAEIENWLFEDEYFNPARQDLPAPVEGISYTVFANEEELVTKIAEKTINGDTIIYDFAGGNSSGYFALLYGISEGQGIWMLDSGGGGCEREGNISIRINEPKEHIVFSWNTTKYSDLTVGSTLDSVNFAFPPKDEILVIDRDTKSIVAPVGYNNTICTYGDVGMTEVYFLVNRYLGKNRELDVISSNITVYVTMNGFAGKDDTNDIVKTNYTAEIADRNKEGLVLITWKIPAGVTAGPGGPGSLKVMLCFEQSGKKWYTNTYSNLTVGENLFNGEVERPSDWDMFEDYVNEAVQHYFEANNFIFSAN